MTTLVSACLLGRACRHDGSACPSEAVSRLLRDGDLVEVCPEELGGLPTPRSPAEISGGDGGDVLAGRARVVDARGVDRTEAFLSGARAALELARSRGVVRAILKARSPSCGAGRIHDGSFTGALRPGSGVTARLLEENGIAVVTDEEVANVESGG